MKSALWAVVLLIGSAVAGWAAPIAPGENQDGTITVGSTDSWTFTAAVNDTLLARVGKLSGTAFAPYLRLYAPNGTLVVQDNGSSDAEVSYRATVAGTYTVTVAGYNTGNAGTYRLRFLRMPGTFTVPAGDEGGALTNGGNHDGTIALGDLDAWSVTAGVNETLLFRVGETTGGSNFYPQIRLYGPDGALIKNDWGGVGAEISHRVTAAGAYTVVVSSYYSEYTGAYRLHFVSTPGTFIVPAGDEGGTLTNGGNHDGTLGAGDLDTWSVTAGVNETLLFRVGETTGGSNFYPQLRLYGPDGALIKNDWGGVGAEISHRATAAGIYTVVVTSYYLDYTGAYRLHFVKTPGTFTVPVGDEGGALTNGGNHDGTIGAGDLDTWSVTAAVNETLLFRVGETTGGSNFYPQLRLYGPDGALIKDDWGGVGAEISHRATAAGTYTVVVTSYYVDYTGAYRLHFVKIPGTFTVPIGDEGGALTNGGNHDGTIGVGDLDTWSVTAAVNETLFFRIGETTGGSNFYPEIRLYGPDGALIKDDWSGLGVEISHRATATGTYTVVVTSYYADYAGAYRLHFYKTPGAFTVPVGDEGGALVNGQNSDGTIGLGDIDPWQFAANVNDSLVIRITEVSGGANFYPQIRLYGPDGALIKNEWGSTEAEISHRATAAGTYAVVVTSYYADYGGAYRLTISGAAATVAPTIVVHPVTQQLAVGASTTLTVSATGTAPLAYQWRRDGIDISGATTTSYAISNAQTTSAGSYLVVVSNGAGSATSNPAVITIGAATVAPTITLQPVAQTTVTTGANVTFVVAATGSVPLAYQWRKDGAALAGETAATLFLSNVAATAAGSYAVVVSNGAGNVTSNAAVLTVNAAAVAPTIATQPIAQTVNTGTSVTFTVVANGTAPLSYQWRKDGAAIAGATNASLPLASPQPADSGSYTVVVTNTLGSVTSNGASLTVIPVVASRISNVSVRTTLAANQTLIVGLSMTGGDKPVLFRGVGPGLAAFGVGGTMPDPRLSLYEGSNLLDANDNWGGSVSLSAIFTSVGAFPLPTASLDASLLRSVDGGRTAQISGTIGGVVLVEAYDAGTGNSPRLVNISARNRAGTGGDILIAGFTIAGTAPKTVLIRAVGPTLTAFGVTGALVDPKLEIYAGSTKVNENDTWSPTLAPTFAAVGAFALTAGSRDAAIVVTLPPGGGYTVQVSGADGGTGEALIEIYEVAP